MEEPQVQEPQMQEPHVQEPHVQETQTNKHITFDVPKTKPAVTKNPGRVAAKKRLAERNRLAREAKKNQQAAAEAEAAAKNRAETAAPPFEESNASNMSGFYILSIAGFLVSLVGLYYKCKEAMAVIKRQPPAPQLPPPEPQKSVPASPPRQPAQRGRIREMD